MKKKKKNNILTKEYKNTLFEKVNTKIGLYANYFIIILIIISIFLVILDTVPNFYIKYHNTIFIIDLFISIIFMIEYFYRWFYSNNKIKFPFRILNIFDFLSFAPFFYFVIIYGIETYSIFAIFRIFRVFRIFELIEKIPIVKGLIRGVKKHKTEYFAALFVAFIILIIFSTIIYLLEYNYGNKNLFSSIPNTLWWGIVTMTTVGYGDIVPSLGISKILAGFLMILGPIIVTILSTITVIVFIESTKILNISGKELVCNKCNVINENDARFCKNCGKKLKR